MSLKLWELGCLISWMGGKIGSIATCVKDSARSDRSSLQCKNVWVLIIQMTWDSMGSRNDRWYKYTDRQTPITKRYASWHHNQMWTKYDRYTFVMVCVFLLLLGKQPRISMHSICRAAHNFNQIYSESYVLIVSDLKESFSLCRGWLPIYIFIAIDSRPGHAPSMSMTSKHTTPTAAEQASNFQKSTVRINGFSCTISSPLWWGCRASSVPVTGLT